MTTPLIALACLEPGPDQTLEKLLGWSGSYYHPADRFNQELWWQRFANIGLAGFAKAEEVRAGEVLPESYL